MNIHTLPRRIRRRFARALPRFVKREEGTSAIEFAIILPAFLLPAWFGFAEIAVMQERTTTLNTTTSMVADMISQYQSVDQTTLNSVMTTARYVLGQSTENSPDFTMMVMGVVVPGQAAPGDPQQLPYVAWSMDHRGGAHPCGTIDLPPGVATPTANDRTVIVADGTLVYDSPFGWDRSRSTKSVTNKELGEVNQVEADGWMRMMREPLRHRSIYAPRKVSNPTGPIANTCPPPTP